MDIGFVWDQEQYKEVQKNHHLQFYEVVSAFDDPNGYEVADPAGYEDRWMWIGRSAHGRVLAAVISRGRCTSSSANHGIRRGEEISR